MYISVMQCLFVADDFGTKSSSFQSAGIDEPIKSANDLQCFSWDVGLIDEI